MKFGMKSMFKDGDVPFIGSDQETPFEKWYNEPLGFAFRSEMIIAEVSPGDLYSLKEYLQEAYRAGQQQMIEQVHNIMRHTIMD